MICISAVFFLAIGFIYASDTNGTDDTIINDDASFSTVNTTVDNMPTYESSVHKVKPKTKSYTDLYNEISNSKSKTVKLHGKYKYDPETDKEFKKGIRISKNIKIIGKDECIIDGAGKARCFVIDPKCKVTLKDITFRNAHTDKAEGGAISAGLKSKLSIYNCIFKNNAAKRSNGGAIFADYKSVLDIHNSEFTANKAIRDSDKKWPKDKRGMGAAIKVNIGSTLKLTGCTFKKNNGYLSTILVLSQNSESEVKVSSADVKKCLFENNIANMNGAFYLDEYGKGKFIKTVFKKNHSKDKGGTLVLDATKHATVKKCKFIKNRGIFGAAIDLFTYNKKISHVLIKSCEFSKNNVEDSGGAIYSDHGELKILDSTFKNNEAHKAGGGVFSKQGKLDISKSTFQKNRASSSGGAIETRGEWTKLVKISFKMNHAKCGGAILLKDRNSIILIKSTFKNNKASVEGKNLLKIINNHVVKMEKKI